MAFVPGTLVGAYEVRELIGTGGMGSVYLARDTRVGRCSMFPAIRLESGRSRSGQAQQVFVQSHPRAGRPVLIAREGGSLARWSPDGRALFYLAPNGSIMAVDVQTTSDVVVGSPRVLLSSAGVFDVDRSGRRFPVSRSSAGQLHAVTNWLTELRQKVVPCE